MKQTKIIIAGTGGVGGYFGGQLARHFRNDAAVQIYFLARGNHLKQIQEHGLKIQTPGGEFTAHPTLATDNPAEIGIADFILVCTKTYDLETVIQQLIPCIGEHTVVLPLLNGLGNREKIQALLPRMQVADGCVYIVSRLKTAGVIENTGNIQTLYFGLDGVSDERFVLLESLLKQAGIEATLSENISTLCWEKFLFLSPLATATSCLNKTVGEILASETDRSILIQLMDEIQRLATAMGISVSETRTNEILKRLEALPFTTTTSMHADFQARKPHTEIESLTGFVIREARKCGIDVPTYEKLRAEITGY